MEGCLETAWSVERRHLTPTRRNATVLPETKKDPEDICHLREKEKKGVLSCYTMGLFLFSSNHSFMVHC